MRVSVEASWVCIEARDWPPLHVHLSFPVMAVLVTWPLWLRFRAHDVTASGLLTLGLMLSVLLHELAHAAAGRALGLPIGPIRLHGDGGDVAVATDRNRPRAEQMMLLAGPASNLMVAALCLAALALLGAAAERSTPVLIQAPGSAPETWQFRTSPPIRPPWRTGRTVLTWLAVGNLWLAFYNLLPLRRHDGWRILQLQRRIRRMRQRQFPADRHR